jgi:hypothetical protein
MFFAIEGIYINIEQNIEQSFKRFEPLGKHVYKIFHPFLLPPLTFIFLLVADTTVSLQNKLIIWTIAVTFSIVIVSAYVLFLKHQRIIDSINVMAREQRIIPLIIGIFSNLIGFLFLNVLDAPNLVQGLMFCYATNGLLVTVITNWWKISIHMTAICTPLIVLAYQFGSVVFPFFGLIPLLGISCLILKKHTLAQVLVAVGISMLMTALQIQFLF